MNDTPLDCVGFPLGTAQIGKHDFQLKNQIGKAAKAFRESTHTPASVGYGHGWCRELNRAWQNGHYAVLARDIQTEWGRITHLFIRNRDNSDIPWAEKQIIKNKLAGYDKLAIEVFPPQAELVDAAGAYHLWVLHDMKLPFGLHADAPAAPAR